MSSPTIIYRQPAWMKRVRVGSILRAPSGVLRIVRRVSWHNDGRLWGVALVIRSCSWTGRAYTVVTASDLRSRGFRLLRAKPLRLHSQMDRQIARAIGANRPYPITCCQVKGIA